MNVSRATSICASETTVDTSIIFGSGVGWGERLARVKICKVFISFRGISYRTIHDHSEHVHPLHIKIILSPANPHCQWKRPTWAPKEFYAPSCRGRAGTRPRRNLAAVCCSCRRKREAGRAATWRPWAPSPLLSSPSPRSSCSCNSNKIVYLTIQSSLQLENGYLRIRLLLSNSPRCYVVLLPCLLHSVFQNTRGIDTEARARVLWRKETAANLAGAFRPTWDPRDGRSCRTVFSEWVSSNNCSAPTVLMALHLYNVLMNLGINDLRDEHVQCSALFSNGEQDQGHNNWHKMIEYLSAQRNTHMANLMQNWVKYFLDEARLSLMIGMLLFRCVVMAVT